jgi:hypothetical protein
VTRDEIDFDLALDLNLATALSISRCMILSIQNLSATGPSQYCQGKLDWFIQSSLLRSRDKLVSRVSAARWESCNATGFVLQRFYFVTQSEFVGSNFISARWAGGRSGHVDFLGKPDWFIQSSSHPYGVSLLILSK